MFTPKRLQFKISEAKKKEGIFCCAYSCKNKPHPKKGGFCHKHYGIHRRIIDPVYDRYINFKGNALRRGKAFCISLIEFRDFCQDTGYIVTKGMRGRKCSVDRKDNRFGYYIWNIQLLTIKQNVAKYHNEDVHMTELPVDHEDYLPF
jgi:hypothetical protein